LDDRLKDYDDVLVTLRESLARNTLYFENMHTSNLAFLKRYIQPDLGTTLLNRRVLATTHTHLFSLAINDLHEETESRLQSGHPNLLFEIATDYGQYVALLNHALRHGEPFSPLGTIPVYPIVEYVDIKSTGHYRDVAKRIAPGCPEVGPLLYFILSQLKTVALLLAPSLRRQEPLFGLRTTLLLAFHSILSLSRIYYNLAKSDQLTTMMYKNMNDALNDPRIKAVLGMRYLRNAVMHFRLTKAAIPIIDETLADLNLARAHEVDLSLEELQSNLVDAAIWLGSTVESWLRPPIRIVHRF